MKPERKLEQQLIKAFEEKGWFAHHFDVIAMDGWPDILAIHGDRFFLIECKAGTKIRTTQQAFFEKMLKRYDVKVIIADASDPAWSTIEFVNALVEGI